MWVEISKEIEDEILDTVVARELMARQYVYQFKVGFRVFRDDVHEQLAEWGETRYAMQFVPGAGVRIKFTDKNAALMFKLRWGGQC